MKKEPLPAPQISFIIPVYNAARYLDEAIKSIIDQNLEDVGIPYEILVVDDGSDEANKAQLKDLAQKYASQGHDNIIFDAIPHAGVSAARNHATRIAKGKYICPVDADDILLEDGQKYIAESIKTLEENPEVFSTYCHHNSFEAHDGLSPTWAYTEKMFLVRCMSAAGRVYRTEDALQAPYPEGIGFAEDWTQGLRLLNHYLNEKNMENTRAVLVPRKPYGVRVRNDGTNTTAYNNDNAEKGRARKHAAITLMVDCFPDIYLKNFPQTSLKDMPDVVTDYQLSLSETFTNYTKILWGNPICGKELFPTFVREVSKKAGIEDTLMPALVEIKRTLKGIFKAKDQNIKNPPPFSGEGKNTEIYSVNQPKEP